MGCKRPVRRCLDDVWTSASIAQGAMHELVECLFLHHLDHGADRVCTEDWVL